MPEPLKDILEMLTAKGHAFAGTDLERAYQQAEMSQVDLGVALLGMGLISEDDLAEAYSELYDLPLAAAEDLQVQIEAVKKMPGRLITRHQVFPVVAEGEEIWVAVCTPEGMKAVEEFARSEAIRVQFVVTTATNIAALIHKVSGRKGPPPKAAPPSPSTARPQEPTPSRGAAPPAASPAGVQERTRPPPAAETPPPAAPSPHGDTRRAAPARRDVVGLDAPEARSDSPPPSPAPPEDLAAPLIQLADESNTIDILDRILNACARRRVSDIHLSQSQRGMVVRFRRDGVLTAQWLQMAAKNQEALIARIKVLAKLDLSEKRQPQDGSFDYSVTRGDGSTGRYSCRVGLVPTRTGEKACIRMLEANTRVRSLDELKFSPEVLPGIRRLARHPSGLILFTGPTGSGKTSASYSFLREIANPRVAVFTVEDPIEYTVDDYYQVQVNEKIGLSFSQILRAFLRQDPDIILVGEIRDAETAQIGATAAMVGRLVMSTLHTNDACDTVTRLTDLGVAPYAVASTLRGAVAVRLVRRLCYCKRPAKQPRVDPQSVREKWGLAEGRLHEPVGCDECAGTGYDGRIPLVEVLTMTSALAEAVIQGRSGTEIRKIVSETGFQPLAVDGWRRALRGETSEEEVLRHLGTQV